ncbi:unnamed protein product [marine sediment metagenome]|uniref:Uncharacterized protein n=1 Tax=marine sediment metagenome TaxID=412755 RepID=X0U4Q4_9ZZZZ
MLLEQSITIPKNTLETNPTIVILKIAKGIITKVMVRPRPGHAALAHLTILHHETHFAPSIGNMDFHGDTFPIDWEEYYESYQPPYELKLKGWNDDDTYPHTFTVYVVVLPRKAVLALAIVDAIKGAFGMLSPKRVQIPTWLGGKKE